MVFNIGLLTLTMVCNTTEEHGYQEHIKTFLKFNNKITVNSTEICLGDINRLSQMRKYIESINTRRGVQCSLAIREIQIKTTKRYCFILISLIKGKKSDNTKCWGGSQSTGSDMNVDW